MKLIGDKTIGKPFPKGEHHPGVLLDANDVKHIRHYHRKGLKLRQLAKYYDVSISTIWKIVQRKTWDHI